MNMHNPPHPGEFIYETYISPFGISIRSLSEKLEVSPSTISRVIKKESGVSPEMACRLSSVLGRTPESWLSMQANYDLWETKKKFDFSHFKAIGFNRLALKHV